MLNGLEHEASQNDVSLNLLVNQIVKKYLEWDRLEDRTDMMPIPTEMFSYMIEVAARFESEEKHARHSDASGIVWKVAEIVSKVLRELVILVGKEYNFDTALSVLQRYMKACGVDAHHRREGATHLVIAYHNLGKTWSLFAKDLLKLVLEDAAKVRVETYATSNVAVARVSM
ncbi:MAG: hypothetical protein AB1351_07755 [Thermoproteota archaeon]